MPECSATVRTGPAVPVIGAVFGEIVTLGAAKNGCATGFSSTHDTASELIVRCYKAQSKHKGLTYPEALEEALCFGWIDGVRRAIAEGSLSNRRQRAAVK